MSADLSTMFLMGVSTTGGRYYAATFGLGGNQTTYDTETQTYSWNKDWLASRLFETGRLDASWLKFFGTSPSPSTSPSTSPSKSPSKSPSPGLINQCDKDPLKIGCIKIGDSDIPITYVLIGFMFFFMIMRL